TCPGPFVLVPGQVADDASILSSPCDSFDISATPNVNLALLAAARANNPHARIVYKPHPDVACGLRKGALEPAQALRYADLIADRFDIAHLIEQCESVETLSSLSGFEAMLRGKPVTVHGLTFY